VTGILPEALAGHFFGVGSLGEVDHDSPMQYMKKLALPYSFQLPAFREEDMIRQFGAIVEGYEEEGEFVLDIDIDTYRDITSEDEPLLPSGAYMPSLYSMMDGTQYPYFKTQQTAPATMCFSIRGSDGKQLFNRSMFHFFVRLMSRIALGQLRHLKEHCETIILCQDDPSLGFVRDMIETDRASGVFLDQIIEKTDAIYPSGVVPAFHYCGDWRELRKDDWFLLWDSLPKLAHIDVLRYPPDIDEEQTERMNGFMKRGGGLALGLLPNVDEGYTRSVLETLRVNLATTLDKMVKTGIDIDLVERNTMLSTQCGLSGASVSLTREIHEQSAYFRSEFTDILERLTR